VLSPQYGRIQFDVVGGSRSSPHGQENSEKEIFFLSTDTNKVTEIKPPQVQFYLRSLQRLEQDILPDEELKVKQLEVNTGADPVQWEKECKLVHEGLMRRLEETDSYSGEDPDLRRKRKEVVRRVQRLLDRLEAL